MDAFGRSDSYGLPDPPSCLVSVYAKDQHKADELLSYAVPLKGVLSLTEEIFITCFLETAGITIICTFYVLITLLIILWQVPVGQYNSSVFHLIQQVSKLCWSYKYSICIDIGSHVFVIDAWCIGSDCAITVWG